MVATDKPTVVAKSLLDAIVMEDFEGDGCLSDPAGANESGGCEFSARPTSSPINSSHPRQVLGAGGDDSPVVLEANIRHWI